MLTWHMVSIGVYEATSNGLRFVFTAHADGSKFINPKLEVWSDNGNYSIQRYRTVGACKAHAKRKQLG